MLPNSKILLHLILVWDTLLSAFVILYFNFWLQLLTAAGAGAAAAASAAVAAFLGQALHGTEAACKDVNPEWTTEGLWVNANILNPPKDNFSLLPKELRQPAQSWDGGRGKDFLDLVHKLLLKQKTSILTLAQVLFLQHIQIRVFWYLLQYTIQYTLWYAKHWN